MKKRIVSGLIALIIAVPLILLGGIYFLIGMLCIASIAFKELIDLKESHSKYPFIMMLIGLFSVFILILANNKIFNLHWGITYPLLAFVLSFLLIPIIFFKDDKYTSKDAFYLIGITMLLGVVFNLFVTIRNQGLALFTWLLIIPVLNDIFAYFIGTKFGKNKLCVSISPNKSWEGSIGGLLGGSILSTVFYCIFIGPFTVRLVIWTIVLSIIGQIGDLVMSKIKRENGIKDFSNLMPGHGGILDRLDSAIFVFLFYAILAF